MPGYGFAKQGIGQAQDISGMWGLQKAESFGIYQKIRLANGRQADGEKPHIKLGEKTNWGSGL